MPVFVREHHSYAPEFAKKHTKNHPGEVVGTISAKHRVFWAVSPHRTDKRTGSTAAPTGMSSYWTAMHKAVSLK